MTRQPRTTQAPKMRPYGRRARTLRSRDQNAQWRDSRFDSTKTVGERQHVTGDVDRRDAIGAKDDWGSQLSYSDYKELQRQSGNTSARRSKKPKNSTPRSSRGRADDKFFAELGRRMGYSRPVLG